MTHRKKPGTIEEAIDEIVGRLGGSETVARMLGAARSTVDSWKNPGRTAYPSIEQAIALDAAYANNTGNSHPTPILAALLLSVEKQRRSPFNVNLVDEALKGRLMMEEIAALLIARVRDGKLGQPATFSSDEVEKLRNTINDAVRCLIRMSQAIEATTNGSEDKRRGVRYSASPL